MEREKRVSGAGGTRRDAEGCLVVAVRVPVRIVVLVVVVPVRVVWDGLVVVGRVVRDFVLRPVGRGAAWVGKVFLVRPLVALWRWGVVPLGRGLGWLGRVVVLVPLGWAWRFGAVPLGSGIRWVWERGVVPVGLGVMWVLKGIWAVGSWGVRWLVVVPAGALYAWVLVPVARAVGVGLYWAGWVLFVPLWRWVLTPLGRGLAFVARGVWGACRIVAREVWDALGHAWRIAGRISVAVWRFVAGVLRWTVVEPARWVYRAVLTPVGHVVRDLLVRPVAGALRSAGRVTRQVLESARETAREVRADLRRALFGGTREREAVGRREPEGADGRTLGRSTTALTKD